MKYTCIETRHDGLIDKFKMKLCRVIYENQEEAQFVIEDIKEETNDEFEIYIRR